MGPRAGQSRTFGKDLGQAEVMVGADSRSNSRNVVRQMLSYGVIGVGSATLDASVFWVLISLTSTPVQLANAAGVVTGVIASFVLNRRFTFRARNRILQRFVVFFGVGMVGLALSAGMLAAGMQLGFTAMGSKAGAILVAAAVQFVLNRSVTFRVAPGDP
jgi:putative flippase GtrA